MDNTEEQGSIRHSTAHVMAEAVLKLLPGSKVAIEPSIYYDFDIDTPYQSREFV